MSLKKPPTQGNKIIRRLLPQHEERFYARNHITDEHGELGTKWYDGFSGLGWAIIALAVNGDRIEAVEKNKRRDSRKAPCPDTHDMKYPTILFNKDLHKTTNKLANKYNIKRESIEGDFIMPHNQPVTGFEVGWEVTINDCLLYMELAKRMTQEKN